LRAQQPPCPWDVVECCRAAYSYDGVVEWIEQQAADPAG